MKPRAHQSLHQTQSASLRPRDPWFLAHLNPFLAEPFMERANLNSEVRNYLRECDVRVTIQGDLKNVIAELFRVTTGRVTILPG